VTEALIAITPVPPADLPRTLGELRASGHEFRTVKEELRDNLLTRLGSGEPRFPGIVGYEDTVLPEVERALLAGHDMVLLGERGQGKTRLIRALVDLSTSGRPTSRAPSCTNIRTIRSPRPSAGGPPRPVTCCRSPGCTARSGMGRSSPHPTPASVT
jgi:hypothetical protein